MTQHLWAIACRAEYPELQRLVELLERHELGARVDVGAHDRALFDIDKLDELGLVVYERPATVAAGPGADARGHAVVIAEMGLVFRDFLRAGGYGL